MQRLALFDIDCTLIDAHGAGGRAIFAAIEDVYGVDRRARRLHLPRPHRPGHHPRPGRAAGACRPRTAGGGRRGVPAALRRAAARTRSREGHIEVLPGVRELVTALAADRRVVARPADRATSRPAPPSSSRRRASPASSRSPPTARTRRGGRTCRRSPSRRAEELTGARFAGKEVAVIGDTPADVGLRRGARRQVDRRGDRHARGRRARGGRRRLRLRRLLATGAPPTRPSWPRSGPA